ncbi:MAG: DUF4157 domain-containing protein [Leptolyngbyaceae cyanobacterium]
MADRSHSRIHAKQSSSSHNLPLNRLPQRSFGIHANPEALAAQAQRQSDPNSAQTRQFSARNINILECLLGQNQTPTVQAQSQPPEAKPQAPPYQPRPLRHDFTTTPFIQPKLTVGAVNDPYEQEADRVAAEVVQRINQPQPSEAEAQQQKAASGTVQRQDAPEEEDLQMKPIPSLQREGSLEEDEEVQMKPVAGLQRQEGMEEEEELQMKPLGSMLRRQAMPGDKYGLMMKPMEWVQREAMEEEDEIQMKPQIQRVGAAGGAVSDEFEQELNSARGGGQALAPELQAQMGQAMGADFSGVRVHTDGRSDALNQAVGARAFTTGQDLFFKRGEYQPGSRGGQELIAHELTHVVQQGGPSQVNTQIQKKQGDDKPAKLHIHADLDAPGMGLIDQLQSGEVGHAWISLEWKDPTSVPNTIAANHKTFLQQGGVQADPMGFWPKMFDTFDPITQQWSNLPDQVGYSSNPFKSYVPGQMVHPDNIHSAKATQSYDITTDQASSVIQYAESKKNAQYSVFFYNCTTFAKEAAQAANVSPPKMGSAGICYPDALYKSIVKNQKNNVGTTSVDDGSGNMVTVEGDAPKKG